MGDILSSSSDLSPLVFSQLIVLLADDWLVGISDFMVHVVFAELLYLSLMLDSVDVEVLEVGEHSLVGALLQIESQVVIEVSQLFNWYVISEWLLSCLVTLHIVLVLNLEVHFSVGHSDSDAVKECYFESVLWDSLVLLSLDQCPEVLEHLLILLINLLMLSQEPQYREESAHWLISVHLILPRGLSSFFLFILSLFLLHLVEFSLELLHDYLVSVLVLEDLLLRLIPDLIKLNLLELVLLLSAFCIIIQSLVQSCSVTFHNWYIPLCSSGIGLWVDIDVWDFSLGFEVLVLVENGLSLLLYLLLVQVV
jgi:hypothetical protein